MGSLNHREVASSCAALPRGADSSPGGLDRSPVDRRPRAPALPWVSGCRALAKSRWEIHAVSSGIPAGLCMCSPGHLGLAGLFEGLQHVGASGFLSARGRQWVSGSAYSLLSLLSE